jgi:hypothetical protein
MWKYCTFPDRVCHSSGEVKKSSLEDDEKGADAEIRPAQQTVFHNDRSPPHLILLVTPRERRRRVQSCLPECASTGRKRRGSVCCDPWFYRHLRRAIHII